MLPDLLSTSRAREMLDVAVQNRGVQLPRAVGISREPFGERLGVKGTQDGVTGSQGASSGSHLVLGACSCHLALLRSRVFLVQNNGLPLPLVLFQMRPAPRSVGSLFTASLASAGP